MLKSALEIAIEKQATHEELSAITEELLEHVVMLEECWDLIQPSTAQPDQSDQPALPEAA